MGACLKGVFVQSVFSHLTQLLLTFCYQPLVTCLLFSPGAATPPGGAAQFTITVPLVHQGPQSVQVPQSWSALCFRASRGQQSADKMGVLTPS